MNRNHLRVAIIATTVTVAVGAASAQKTPLTSLLRLPDKRPTFGVRATGSPTKMSVTRINLDKGGESPALLSDLELIPVEVGGRTPLSPAGDHGARVIQVGSVQLAQLPGPSAVRVVHYRKTGPTRFGFFSIYGAGEVRPLIERPGVGPGNSLNPFDPIVAAHPDGETIAISSADYSGGIGGFGDTWLFRTAATPFQNGSFSIELTGPGEQEVPGSSLVFFDGLLYANLEEELARAPEDGSSGFVPLAVPGLSNPTVVEEMVLAKSGDRLAFLAGANEDSVDIFVVQSGGAISRLTQNPGAIQPPGYLPFEETGPHLAFSSDGALVSYDREIANGHELYIQSTQPGSTPFHVTPDALFEHSIDNVSGILTGLTKTKFFADSGLNDADLYQAELIGSTLTLTNLTATSGSAAPMFPNLATIDVVTSRGLGESRVIVEKSAPNQHSVWFATGSTPAQVATQLVAPPLFAAPADGEPSLAVTTARSSGTDVFVYDGTANPLPLVTVPPGLTVSDVALSSKSKQLAFVADQGAESFVISIDPTSHAIHWVGGTTFRDARSIQYARKGELLFTGTEGGNGVSYVVDPTGKVSKFPLPTGVTGDAIWLR